MPTSDSPLFLIICISSLRRHRCLAQAAPRTPTLQGGWRRVRCALDPQLLPLPVLLFECGKESLLAQLVENRQVDVVVEIAAHLLREMGQDALRTRARHRKVERR